jgi:hypothetical protein
MIRRTGVVTGWLKAGFAIDPYDALLSATGATHGNVFRLFPAMTRPGQDRLGPERRVGLLAGLGAEHCQLARRRLCRPKLLVLIYYAPEGPSLSAQMLDGSCRTAWQSAQRPALPPRVDARSCRCLVELRQRL